MRHIDRCAFVSRLDRCAFVYALLAAFLEPPEAWSVFGDDLLQVSGPTAQRFEELLGARSVTRLPDGRALPGRDALAAQQAATGRGSPESRLLRYLDGHSTLKPLDCVGVHAPNTDRSRRAKATPRCRI